jgi:hypothetical protein
MNKALKIMAVFVVVVVVIVGYLSIPKTVDFRGTVTKIEHEDDQTVFYISLDDTISYVVVANSKTKVAYDDHRTKVQLGDIAVGHTIQGNYRPSSKDKVAKSITILY